jgi:hypothetical protein
VCVFLDRAGRPAAAYETASLYAKDAVLWGTVSEQLRVTPAEILDYFQFFTSLQGLKVTAYQPFIRVMGDVAINDGYYVFSFVDSGKPVETKARYTFVYRRSGRGNWEILDHHSSALPKAPGALKKATTVLL